MCRSSPSWKPLAGHPIAAERAAVDDVVKATANWRTLPGSIPGSVRELRFTRLHCPCGPFRQLPARRFGTTGSNSGKVPKPNPEGRAPLPSHPPPANPIPGGSRLSPSWFPHRLRKVARPSLACGTDRLCRWLAAGGAPCTRALSDARTTKPTSSARIEVAAKGERRVSVVHQRTPRRAEIVTTQHPACKRTVRISTHTAAPPHAPAPGSAGSDQKPIDASSPERCPIARRALSTGPLRSAVPAQPRPPRNPKECHRADPDLLDRNQTDAEPQRLRSPPPPSPRG